MTLSLQDLLDALEVADDPAARKRLKNAICALADPDPLTVTDELDLGRHATAGRPAADRHDQHPHLRQGERRGDGPRRWLDRALMALRLRDKAA